MTDRRYNPFIILRRPLSSETPFVILSEAKNLIIYYLENKKKYVSLQSQNDARMAELVDALLSGGSVRKDVSVRL